MSHPPNSQDHNNTTIQQQHNKRVAGALLLRTSPRFVSGQGGPPKKRHKVNRDRDNPPERADPDDDGRRVTRSRVAKAGRSSSGDNAEGRDCGDTRMTEAVPREGSPRSSAEGTAAEDPIPVVSRPVPMKVQAPVIVQQQRPQNAQPRPAAPMSAAELAARAERRAAWPLRGILEPGENDCLFGRGGGTNHHPGNKVYRQLVEGRKAKYMASKRLDKPLVAMEIIDEWRALDPPGRFLKQDDHTKVWNDVGDKKAREKTSQALREKQIVSAGGPAASAESAGAPGPPPPPPPPQRQARFEPGTTSPVSRNNKRPVMGRDHSLGTTEPGVDVSLAGFSWDEGDDQPEIASEPSAPAQQQQPQFQGEYHGGYGKPPPLPPPPPPSSYQYPEDGQQQHRPPPYYHDPYYGPHYHYHHPPPHTPGSHGGHPPPMSPYGYHPHYSPSHAQHAQHYGPRPPQFCRDREHSLQSNPLNGATTEQAQKPDTFREREGGGASSSRAGSYEDAAGGSSGSAAAAPGYGESSPHYYSHPPPPHGYHYPPPPHGPPHGSPYHPPHTGSGSAFGPYGERRPDENAQRMYDRRDGGSSSSAHSMVERQRSLATSAAARASVGSSTDYSRIADLIVRDSSEKTEATATETTKGGSWDEHGVKDEAEASSVPRSNSMPPEKNNLEESFVPPRPTSGAVEVEKPSLMRKISGGALHRPNEQLTPPSDGVCRPEPVKRETSNQPESLETKRSVKRVVLSRDKSQISKNLKEQQQASGESSAQPSVKLTKAEMLDRRLSVEINRLGIGNGDASGDGDEGNVGALPPSMMDRLTTEDMVNSFIDGDLEGLEDDPVVASGGRTSGSPPTISAPGPTARLTTMDKIAMEVLDGKPPSDWDAESLNLVDSDEAGASVAAADVDSETASRWLKSGSKSGSM